MLFMRKKNVWTSFSSVCLCFFSPPCKLLKPEFRLDYCRLWQSLIKGDMKGIERYSRRLGAGDLYPLFACVLTARSWSSVSTGISQTPVTNTEVSHILLANDVSRNVAMWRAHSCKTDGSGTVTVKHV